MSKSSINSGIVSWEVFDALYENQADFCRKIDFLVRAGRATKEESLALDLIIDQLNFKEGEILGLREKALQQAKRSEELTAREESEEPGPTYSPEEMSIIEKLESIRQKAGYPWENIKSIIEGTYSSMQKKGEE